MNIPRACNIERRKDDVDVYDDKMKKEGGYRYNEEQKMTEFGRSSISEALSNFSCSSLLPMTLAAWLICRMSSCRRRKTRIRLPSN